MKATLALLVIAQAIVCVKATGGASGCAADNCARQITGTARGLAIQSARRDDCSSYFQPIITPATVTVSVTETTTPVTNTITVTDVTVTVTDGTVTTTITAAPHKRRDFIRARQLASVKPTYASACDNFSAYRSACSCWGVTPYTITLPTPTERIVIIVTATATATDHKTKTITIPASTATVISCASGYTDCGGSCVNLLTDKDNCGTCGNKCAFSCSNGQCNACTEAPAQCGAASYCGDRQPCTCVMTTEGHTACVTSENCQGRTCEKSSDCSSVQVCVVDACCNQGTTTKICMPSPNACPNGHATRRLFKMLRTREIVDLPAEFDPNFVPELV